MKKSELKQLIREILAEQMGVAPVSGLSSMQPPTGGTGVGPNTAPVGQTQAAGGGLSDDNITQLEQTFEAMLTSGESPELKKLAQQSLNVISKNRSMPNRLKELLRRIWDQIISGGSPGPYLQERPKGGWLISDWRALIKAILGL